MLAKTIESYDAPWIDQEALANPETQQPASSMNRIAEDAAQMTRTSSKIMVKFLTDAAAAPVAIPVVDSTSQWGEGVSYAPTISKTGVGIYTVTYAVEYPDALVGTEGNDAVAETEQVSFRFSWGNVIHPTGPLLGHARALSVDNVVTVYVFNAAGTPSDFGGGAIVQVFAR